MGFKTGLRDAIARGLFFAGITAPARRGRGHLSIATFHRVLPEADRLAYPYPGLAVTPAELEGFLAYLTEHFECGTLAAQHSRYLDGGPSERPLLALTFDDGQYDNYRHARPVLARHNVNATFFVPVEAVERKELLWHDRLGFAVLALAGQEHDGRQRLTGILSAAGLTGQGARDLVGNIAQESKALPLDARLRLVEALAEAAGVGQGPEFARLMTFDELRDLAADGHEIGSHSMSHCLMPECDDRTLGYELNESRRILESRLGRPVESFCYPNGDADARTALAAGKAGYRRAVTTAWGRNSSDTDRFLLHRQDMVAAHSRDAGGRVLPALLAFRMSGFFPGLG